MTHIEGGFNTDGDFISPISQVVNGEADFGLADSDELILARANGEPVVAIATIYQANPLAFMSLAENNIQRPEDLEGKRVTGTGLGITALLNSQELTDKVTYIERADFSNDALLSGEVDAIDVFVTNQPITLENEGVEYNLILLSDYGIDIYANVIFTTEAMLLESPDVVERFLDSVLSGYQLAIEDPQAATEESVKQSDTLVLEFEAESMLRSIPLIAPVDSPPGMMTEASWEYTYSVMLNQGLINEDLDISKVYTMDVLNAVYSE